MGFRDGSTGFRHWGLEGIVSSHPTRERSWLKSDAYTGSGKGEREGAERYGGGRRFGYMTWYVSQPSPVELLNWSKNFTQNNHKIRTITQLSARLLYKPKRGRSQEDSKEELAWGGGSGGPLTRRASSVAWDDSITAKLVALRPAAEPRRLPRTSPHRAAAGCRFRLLRSCPAVWLFKLRRQKKSKAKPWVDLYLLVIVSRS